MSKNTNIADLINYISVDGSGNVVLTTGGQVATQSYVTTAVSNLVNSAPSTLDTLNELAAALGNDANFATTVTNSIATKQSQLNGTGFVKVSGTTVSYDNSTYLTTSSASSTYLPLSGGNISGNFTIGSPSSALAQLHVYNASAAASFLLQTNSSTAYSEIAVRNYNQASTSYFRQYSSGASGTDFGISRGNLATFFSNYASNFAIGTQNGGDLILGTANTERMRILASGNIGIGTASNISASLTIYTTSAANQLKLAGTAPASVFTESLTSPSYVGVVGLATSSNNFLTGSIAGDFVIANQKNFSILFGTGSTTTEKMRITSGGDLALGTSTVSWASANRRVVEINGTSQVLIGIKVGDVQKGYIYHNGTNLYTENSNSGGDWYLAQVGAGNMIFSTNGSERMRITSGGNVLMNTTTNSTSGGFTNTTLLIKQKDNGGSGGGLQIEANGSDNVAFFGFAGTNSPFCIGTSYRTSGSYQPIAFFTNGYERMRITNDGITQVSNLRTTNLYNEYTKNLSGAYSAGTYYEIVNSSQMASGIYIVMAYVDTYAIGGDTYFCTYVSVPFFFYTQGTNNGGAVTLPTMIGSGHANMNPPTIRIRLSSGSSGGLTYVEFDPNANWSNVQGVGGATVVFYLKRIGN